MKRLTAATPILAATALLSAPASAHHSMSMFDTTQEILIEGTVARFDWVNPHMYLIVETKGPDGKPALVEGEGLGITQALVDGLDREALKPGTPVVVRANPNRGGWGKQVRIQDVTTQDGEIHPFYAANRRTASSRRPRASRVTGRPPRAALGAAFGAMARWPVTPEGRAAQAELAADGICTTEPTPVLSILDELRTIERRRERGRAAVRQHGRPCRPHRPYGRRASRQRPAVAARALHRPVGGRDARDRYDRLRAQPIRHRSERAGGARQAHGRAADAHEDRLRLRYEVTVEDPMYLSGPATLTQQWDHRPDLEFSQNTGACDPEVANRYKDHVPK